MEDRSFNGRRGRSVCVDSACIRTSACALERGREGGRRDGGGGGGGG